MFYLPRLQVGIDVSKERLDFALLAPDGRPIEVHRPFPNSQPGYLQAKQFLLETMQAQGFGGLDLAGEATSYYWLPAFISLALDPDLAAYEPRLYLLNARWVYWYKQSLSPDHKDDQTDPQYIADRLRTHPPSSTWQYDPHWLKLRFWTRLHVHLTKGLGREKNLFQLYLFLAHSAYTSRHPFSDPLGQTSRSLLRQPELLERLSRLDTDELAEQLDSLSGGRLPTPEDNAEALRRAMRDSFRLPDELAEPVQGILEQLLEIIESLEGGLAQVDQQVTRMVAQESYPEVTWLDSIPGLGSVVSTGLATEIAGLERFQQVPKWDKKRKVYRKRRLEEVQDAVAKMAGLWWPKNASGQFVAEERRMSKAGNAYLRYYILLAADRMRQCIPSYAAYYAKKHAEANKHRHKRALVLTGHKALGLFVSLLHHQEAYRAKEADLPLS